MTYRITYITGRHPSEFVDAQIMEKVDGSTWHNVTIVNTLHPHSDGINYNDKETHWFTLTANVTKLYGSQSRIRISLDGGGTNVKLLIFTSIGIHTITYYVNPSGKANAPPTYLEELHKLDNFSPIHYIPRI